MYLLDVELIIAQGMWFASKLICSSTCIRYDDLSYYDGCNDCTCGTDGIPGCTYELCSSLSEPFCTGCEPGYILNPSTNKCEGCMCTMQYDPVCCNGKTYGNSCTAGCQQATACVPGACGAVKKMSLSCGGFENCETFYDGCNNCVCRNGMAACTKMMCFRKGPSRCTRCAAGYTLSGSSCV